MEELKTLKDFEKICITREEEFILYCVKAEAIKWVKDLDDKELLFTKKVFMKFFNINEDDLK